MLIILLVALVVEYVKPCTYLISFCVVCMYVTLILGPSFVLQTVKTNGRRLPLYIYQKTWVAIRCLPYWLRNLATIVN